MSAFVMANLTVTNKEKFEIYRSGVSTTIEKYEGRYVVRGGEVEVLEGNWSPDRFVLIEFPNIEKAREWYYSSDYSDLKTMRIESTSSSVLIVDGV